MPSPTQLDAILACQLLVAWAGERSEDEPRLGWWNTDMYSEFGGHDLFRRLSPRTARWAALEVARKQTRRCVAAQGWNAPTQPVPSLVRRPPT